ncbi:hypothetical protein Tco_1375816 [Tanacetum coccineum]
MDHQMYSHQIHLTCLFSLSECLKADSTIRVNRTDDDTNWGNPKGADSVVNDSDSEPDEELILKGPNKNTILDSGASTPVTVDSTASSSHIDIMMREFRERFRVEENEVPRSVQSFKEVVQAGWSKQVSGFCMFKVVQRLKHLKKPLQKLLYEKGNLHSNVTRLREEVDRIQTRLDSDPFNVALRENEAAAVNAFNEALAVKARINRSRIEVVTCNDGTIVANEKVADAFVSHYEQFLGLPKIIANRIKESLKILVSPNQSAFVPRRSIADNILLTQDLMHNYHLDRGVARCAFKVDIQKAYDTVDWNFLKDVLIGFGFHVQMVGWIMECVTTASFSISINGSLHGYFKRKRGLRQGDPLSPYLFTLVMEILTLMIQRRVLGSTVFKYHRYCEKLELVNLCFADDLFLFVHGDVGSASLIKYALEEFKSASGLNPSLPKSTAYFCNVLNHTKLSILNILSFEEGKLPVKYLGDLLVSSRLVIRDCKELVNQVQSRVQDWKNKSLSAAGRLQLIKFVIGSMHVYWASVFIIPSRVLLDIEQIMRCFLWCQGDMCKGRAKVSWGVIYLPKDEGGIGLRRLDMFNKALMILQLRPFIREYVWYNIRDGTETSVWFDSWCQQSPLASHISTRDIFRSGLDLSAKVHDVIANGTWKWPTYLATKYSFLDAIVVPQIIDGVHDWSVKVDWYAVVWHNHCIPRHAFNLWLVVKQRLKTQDRVAYWDVSASLATVWNNVKMLAGLNTTSPDMNLIISYIVLFASRKSIIGVIAKLVVAAAAYFIWQEHNNRLFKNSKWMVNQVIDCIVASVRLKLMSCSFKKLRDGVRLAQAWRLPDTCFR